MLSDKVISIIANTRRIPLETITLDSSFEELQIDSLDAVEIVFALEEEFNVSVPDEMLSEIRTVRNVIDRLEARLSAEAAAPLEEAQS